MPNLLTSNVPLAPSAKTTETVLPDWYTNYAQGVLANQQALMNQPYQAYGGPRVAGFSADQNAAFDATRSAAGAYAPGLANANQTVNTAASITPSAGAQGYLTAAGQTAPQVVGSYMSPYQTAVTDRIAQLGNRNFSEKLMPMIGDQFISAGGYGSTRQAQEIGRAARDTQESITAEQAKYLDSGYQGALGAAQTDLARQGALAQTAGSLATADVNAKLAAGQAQGVLAAQGQTLGLTGAGALGQVGALQQGQAQKNLDVAYGDFKDQKAYDQQQLDAATKTLQGVAPAVPKGALETGYGPAPSGGSQSPSTAQTISNLVGAWLLSQKG